MAGLLQRSALRFALHTAAEDLQGNKISYAALNAAADQLSKLLKEQGISFGDRVGILAPKSITSLSCLFGILKSEAAYVPLDSQAPLGRNLLISRDCQLRAIFIDRTILQEFKAQPNFTEKFRPIRIDETFSLITFDEEKIKHTQQLAYLLYTSGSSGSPKGVKHSHFSAYSFVKWSANRFGVQENDRVASHAPFHFDLSVFDIFTTLVCGATLVLFDEKTASNPLSLASALSDKQISIFYTTPSVLSYLSTYGKLHKHSYARLKTLLFAGEVFPIHNLRKIKDILPDTSMFNLYGPTETNVCTWYPVPDLIPENKTEPFPIGKPCDYASFTIIKTKRSSKNEGELWIGGDSLMNGYWNDETKTDTALEVDISGKLWYRTGDIVCLDKNGQLVYMRRKDRMIKRRGYRVELNEIENHLRENKNVLEAAVTANSPNGQTDNLVTAHVVWNKNSKASPEELIEHCNVVLPSYMLPDRFVFHESLPKTSTNKINYVALTNA